MYENEVMSATEINNYYEKKCGEKLSRTRWHDEEVRKFLDAISDGKNRLEREEGTLLHYDTKDAEAMAMFQTFNKHLGRITLKSLTDNLINSNPDEFLEEYLNRTASIDRIILATMQAYIFYLKQEYGQYWGRNIDWFMLYKCFTIYQKQKSTSERYSIEWRFEQWAKLKLNQYVSENYEGVYTDLESDYEYNYGEDEEEDKPIFEEWIEEKVAERFKTDSISFFEIEGKTSFLEVKKDYSILTAIDLPDHFYEKLFQSMMEYILLDKWKSYDFWYNWLENWGKEKILEDKGEYSYLTYTASREEMYVLEYVYVKATQTKIPFSFGRIVFRNMLEKEDSLVEHLHKYKKQNVSGLEKLMKYIGIHNQSYSLDSEGIESKIKELTNMFNLDVPDYFELPNHVTLFNNYAISCYKDMKNISSRLQ